MSRCSDRRGNNLPIVAGAMHSDLRPEVRFIILRYVLGSQIPMRKTDCSSLINEKDHLNS